MTTSAFLSGIGGHRTHIVRFKRPVHYPVCHNPVYLFPQSAWRELNPRPSSYKDAARTTELHAVKVRPEGFEPTPRGLKVRCATVTPQPLAWLWLCVSIEFVTALQSLSFLATQSVPSGSPEDRTQRDPVISRIWATSPRLPFASLHQVGCVGIEPLSIVPNDVCQPLHFTPDNLFLSVDLLGVEPRSLKCKSKRRPVGKPV